MTTPLSARPRLSALTALQEAVELVGRRLFPFRLGTWFTLGFVAFLDSCGRGGFGMQFPGGGGGGGGGGSDSGATGGGPDFGEMRDWFAEYLPIVVVLAVIGLLLVLTLVAIVLWINSRGVFMYLDNLASGRAEVVRPWRQHAHHAWSYFGWNLGLALATFAGVLLLLVPLGWSIYLLVTGGASCGPIGGVVASVLLILLLAVVSSLVGLLLRDFAAPLQLHLGVRCGQALRLAGGLVKANPLPFLAYVVLKMLFSLIAAIVALVVGCFTCCIGFLPVISHTILQPLLYFERAWSLMMLRQAGYDLFAAFGSPPPALPSGPPADGSLIG
jgi:hypothetical protein